MPDRIVRAGILTSELVNQLSWAEECFYRRLMNVVDDFGRYDGRSSILRAVLYPLKINRVSERDVATWLRRCEETGLVTVYQVESKQYLEIVKFDQRLRAKQSKWPPPPSSADRCQQPSADDRHTSSNATEEESETETESESETKSAQAPPGLDFTSWERWVAYRRQIRKPIKPASFSAAQEKLAEFGADQAAVVQQSIANGWQGLFALKTSRSGGGNGKRKTYEDYANPLEKSMTRVITGSAERVDD